jgi:hypothetical protein
VIFVDVAGDEAVARAFERAGSWVRERFKRVVDRSAESLRAQVQDEKLSGTPGPKRKKGDPLGVGSVLAARTRKLRNSVVAKAFEFEQTYSVRIYPTASKKGARYGFMLGTGAHETVNVHGYTRAAPKRDRFASAHASASGKVRVRKFQSGVEFVKAARRKVNLNRRPFTTSVLAARRGSISLDMQAETNMVAAELQAQVNGVQGGGGI